MKKILTIAAIIWSATNCIAQKANPVNWNYSAQKLPPIAGKGDRYEVHLTATMQEGWHIYAQVQPKEAISEPTKIVFSPNPMLVYSGKPKELGTKEKYEDKTAGIIQYQYGGQVDFVQLVDMRNKVKTSISGTITYQVCTGEMCLPPKTVSFIIALQ